MGVDILYKHIGGRALMKLFHRVGAFRVGSWFLKTDLSRILVPRYIRKNQIDMAPFGNTRYPSFAAFFSRTKEIGPVSEDPRELISPCDGLLSVYPVSEEMNIPMKGSHYLLTDLIPDRKTAESMKDGLCLVFRLQASDYHHFCSFDDAKMGKTHYIPGQLHSVQPIACETYPVYRLNRRWWREVYSENFGKAVQVEVGAMMVGGVTLAKECGKLLKGEEMGNFELAGSTVVLLLESSVRKNLSLYERVLEAMNGEKEVPVHMGEGIGKLRTVE